MSQFFFKFNPLTAFSLSAPNFITVRHIVFVIIVSVMLTVGLIVCFSLVIMGVIILPMLLFPKLN